MWRSLSILSALMVFGVLVFASLIASNFDDPIPKDERQPDAKGPDDKGGPPFGFGPPMGGPNAQKRKILKDFDKDGSGWLNKEERASAREFLKKNPMSKGGPFGKGVPGGKGGFGPPGFGKGKQDPPKPGAKVEIADAKSFPDAKLYDPTVLRTIFMEFDNADWEAELADFRATDVDVPVKMTVDGREYPNVGVHFRGASSYFTVPAGYKRSFNISMDLADSKQKLLGHKTLNLLNSHDDPSYMSTLLYSHISQPHVPTPKANLVKVVINGENWGVYVNVEQFNKEFLQEHYKTTEGMRWKVSGSPGGGGGLDFVGDNVADYKLRYELKSKDSAEAWQALVDLCRVVSKTPIDELEQALTPILDIDSLLWFLAIDCAVINCDGYWIRASDYSLYRDPKGKFHVIPHDMNECFRPAMGPGFGGFGGPGGKGPKFKDKFGEGPKDKLGEEPKDKSGDEPKGRFIPFPKFEAKMGGGRASVDLDPLIGMNDAKKPLRSRVLAVPNWREQYLRNVRSIAEESLDWKHLGPIVGKYRDLIGKEVDGDTRKLDSYEDFLTMTVDAAIPDGEARRTRNMSLRAFADQRRAYLLKYQVTAKRPN